MKPRLIAVIALAALTTAGCGSSEGGGAPDTASATTSTSTSTVATSTSTTTPMLEADAALSIAHSYFESYNSGDGEAVLALFSPDATFSDNFGPQTREAWEQLLAWNVGQGTLLDSFQCAVANEGEQPITVSCTLDNLDALVQAVAAPPVPITQTLTITPDGIIGWDSHFGQPDFNTVWDPFRSWMTENHPEDLDSVGFGNWGSVEEATQNGLLTAEYADIWRAYLEANNCGYSDYC